MKIAQVCAYANWPTESVELWKWHDVSKPSREIIKEMSSLFHAAFPMIVKNRSLEDLQKQASRTVAKTDMEIDVTKKEASGILEVARFAHYVGQCLDKERLQYFAPSKILSCGTIVINGNGLSLSHDTPRSNQMSAEDKGILQLREALQDDPRRVESDRLRASLGQTWNYLFDWKMGF